MTEDEILKLFLDGLTRGRDAHTRFTAFDDWTKIATSALVDVARATSTGKDVQVAARNHKDPYGRSEYNGIDVCAYDNTTWGPALFIAEHENAKDIERVKYCAWKLLITDAARRVLVAYYLPKNGFEGMVKAVSEVAEANPGRDAPRDVLVIGAPWDARPASPEALRALFHARIVGKR